MASINHAAQQDCRGTHAGMQRFPNMASFKKGDTKT